MVCAPCHGAKGEGTNNAYFPRLAGKPAGYLTNQLFAFHTGHRHYPPMNYLLAYLAAVPLPRIVINGAPLRNITPCGSRHGALDNKVGSPWLEGQSAAYIKSQLEAFASNARRNDISQQMRNIARRMTPEEIQEAAEYYAAQPSPDVRP